MGDTIMQLRMASLPAARNEAKLMIRMTEGLAAVSSVARSNVQLSPDGRWRSDLLLCLGRLTVGDLRLFLPRSASAQLESTPSPMVTLQCMLSSDTASLGRDTPSFVCLCSIPIRNV